MPEYADPCVPAHTERINDFVKRDSYIVYQKARLEEADKLLRGVKNGELVSHVPMDGAVFVRVCKGLEVSVWKSRG